MSVTTLEALAAKRRLFLFGTLDDEAAMDLVRDMLWLDRKDIGDILLCVCCGGGSMRNAFALHDCMQGIESDVRTLAMGHTDDAGTIVLCSGAPGKRHALPNAKIVLGEFLAQDPDSTHSESMSCFRSAEREMETMKSIVAARCGWDYDDIMGGSRNDAPFTAGEARARGLIDSVVRRIPG